MSTEEENRLTQLKQLQEQLQAKLLSQLSSEDSISEEMKLEILQTLGMSDQRQHQETTTNKYHQSSPSSDAIVRLTPRGTEQNLLQTTVKFTNLSLSELDGSPMKQTSPLNIDYKSLPHNESNSKITPVKAWQLLSPANEGGANSTPQSLSIASTEFLNLPEQSESELVVGGKRDSCCDVRDHNRSKSSSCTLPQAGVKNLSDDCLKSSPSHETVTVCHAPQSGSIFSEPYSSPSRATPTTEAVDWAMKEDSEYHAPSHQDDPSLSQQHDSSLVGRERFLSTYQQRSALPSPGRGFATVDVERECLHCPRLQTHFDQLLAENTQWKVECGRMERHVEDCMRYYEIG